MKLFLTFTIVFYLEQHLVECSKIPWCLEASTRPTEDGPLLCGLPYFVSPQVPLICQVSNIVSFYPQYILNSLTSLFTWHPAQKVSLTSLLTHL